MFNDYNKVKFTQQEIKKTEHAAWQWLLISKEKEEITHWMEIPSLKGGEK